MIIPRLEIEGKVFLNLDISILPAPEQQRLLTLLRAYQDSYANNALSRYEPYRKQLQFHNTLARERMFMAGNQIGKTWASASEVAIHLAGLYPDWWRGKFFDHAVASWVGGVTGESIRDTMQRLLLGRVGSWGTGTIPKDKIIDISMSRGVPDLVDTIQVRADGGGVSTVAMKSYEKGRAKWQGETLDFVAFDEEPPIDIYSEGLTRVQAVNGIVWLTFTPLLGMSDTVKRFLQEKPEGTAVIRATIEDALHYTAEERRIIVAGYPAHEREARAKGIPMLGSGRIYPVAEETLKVDPFPIPMHWKRVAAIDFGYDHPTAVVWLAIDPDSKVIYVTDVYKLKQQTPVVHAAIIKVRGEWIPCAWPHDGLQHDKGGSCEQLKTQYENLGVKMLKERAQFEDQSNGVEAGITLLLTAMQLQQFKVFSHLNDWFEEFRMYHRKDGKIVKSDDDLMDATRYACMSLRFAVSAMEASPKAFDPMQFGTIGFGVLDPEVGY